MNFNYLARFITQNGIKKSWFAAQLGVSRELFGYYCRPGVTVPPAIQAQAVRVIKSIRKNSHF